MRIDHCADCDGDSTSNKESLTRRKVECRKTEEK